jgi:hypothetical protein
MKKGKILIIGLIALLMAGGLILASCDQNCDGDCDFNGTHKSLYGKGSENGICTMGMEDGYGSCAARLASNAYDRTDYVNSNRIATCDCN